MKNELPARSVPRGKHSRPVISRWPTQKGIDLEIHGIPVQTHQPARLLVECQSNVDVRRLLDLLNSLATCLHAR